MRRTHSLPRLQGREELDALCAGEQLDRQCAFGIREHLPGLEAGGVSHGDVILLAGARRDGINAGRMAERLVLADEGRSDVLRNHEAGVETAVHGEKGRQSVGQVRVDETLHPPLRDVRQLGARHRQGVERERERLAVEVAVRDEHFVLDQNERIVGRRIELHRDRSCDVAEEVSRGTVHLGRAPQRVRVLHLVAPLVRLVDGRSFEQPQDVGGGVVLASQGPKPVDLRQEARARSLESFERKCAGEVSALDEPLRAHRAERAERCHELRAVDQRQTFLGGEPRGLEVGGRKSLPAREQLSVEPGVALADERQSQVSKGREIATGTNRSTARHIRKDAPRQTLDEQLDRLDPRPRSPLRKRVRAEPQPDGGTVYDHVFTDVNIVGQSNLKTNSKRSQ